MIQIAGIKPESIRASLLKVGRSAPYAIPLQLLSYTALVSFRSEFQGLLLAKLGLGCILVSAGIRFFLRFRSEQLLKTAKGENVFRLLLFTTIFLIVLPFDWALIQSYQMTGVSSLTVEIGAVIAIAVATVLNICAIDLTVGMASIALFTLLPAAAIFILSATASFYWAVAWVLYGVYSMLMAVAARKREILIMKSHDQLSAANDLIRGMHESINEAFLIFNSDGKCTNIASERSRKLIDFDSYGQSILDILRIPENQKKNTEAWFQLLFFDRLDFAETAARGPSLLNLPGDRVLKLNFSPMRNEGGKLKEVILTAIDATQEARAERSIAIERERAQLILRIVENRSSFKTFLDSFENSVEQMLTWAGADLATLRRELHTLKGSAMLFGATAMGNEVYQLELSIRENETSPQLVETVQSGSQKLMNKFKHWKTREEGLFSQLGVFADSTIEISQTKLKNLKEKHARSAPAKAILEPFFQDLLNTDLCLVFKEYQAHIEALAAKLGKRATLKVEEPSEPILLPPGTYRETLRNFIHLFNNSLDHGIEASEVREARGKAATGIISVKVSKLTERQSSWIRIEISDDGGGINISKLRKSLIEKNDSEVEHQSDLEVAMSVFKDGLSTKDSVSEISGQGVGMGSVRAAVQKVRGKIVITQTGPSGTTFEVLLPDVTQGLRNAA